jgi:hypothetical protein
MDCGDLIAGQGTQFKERVIERVVFYTHGGSDPLPERLKPELRVDAVSSASRLDRAETAAETLANLIESKFPGGEP